jgi:S1-C subfamily serine protease
MNTPALDPAQFSDALAQAVENAARSVVLVNARRRMPASGILISALLVLTANHVVEHEEDISILLSDGSELSASLAGRDPSRDLALLKLSSPASTPAATTATQSARVGQLVLALGRPDEGGIQASLGVINAIGGPVRMAHGGLLEQYMRTDTTAFPGFSGGPLINVNGEVLGLNTSALAMGALITLPTPLAWQAAADLEAHGHIRRAYLGLRSQVTELGQPQQTTLGRQQSQGLLLVGVETDSPAEKSGLLVGDILVGMNGDAIVEADDLQTQLARYTAGTTITVDLLRGGQPKSIPVILGERA